MFLFIGFLLVISNSFIIQWGIYKESSSVTDIRYFPMSFDNKLLYAHSADISANNDYRSINICWIYTDNLSSFILGEGNDYSPINTNNCIFIGY